MAIIALKAWYLREYEPIRDLEKRPHDLRLSKNSLLKSGLRADFLEDSSDVKQSEWFQRYLEGEPVEFYIEGSGGYVIANIDLISHEMYFTKQDVMASLDPTIFLCYQTDYAESGDLLREELTTILDKINFRSRIPITLEESHRLTDGPARLSSSLTRKIRKSLLFIADTTPILHMDGTPPRLVPNPNVCVEVGYALQAKRSEQILLAQMERSDMTGQFPFDIPVRNRLQFRNKTELRKILPQAIEAQLQRFNLVS
ncbi:MAG TPA: hypothetical protein V6C78_06945 [Crinalium sp.]|jgi:hypothetical protein